jgi:hypothetical protein
MHTTESWKVAGTSPIRKSFPPLDFVKRAIATEGRIELNANTSERELEFAGAIGYLNKMRLRPS